MRSRSPAKQLAQAVRILDDFYGRAVLAPRLAPVDELVFTVLSQNTADVNTERTFAALKGRFPEWAAVRDAAVADVEEAIALGGLAHTKAPRIKAILAAISPGMGPGDAAAGSEDGAAVPANPAVPADAASPAVPTDVAGPAASVNPRVGEPDLSALSSLSDSDAQAYLTGLPGVGPKTAACVLLFSLGRPVMPVDTHVHRVAGRLGIIAKGVTAEQAHPILTELAGPKAEDVYAAHVAFVRHGRRICHARRPACGECPLAGICPSAFVV